MKRTLLASIFIPILLAVLPVHAQETEIVQWEVQVRSRDVSDGMTVYNVETIHYNPVVFPPGTTQFTGFMQGVGCGLTDHSGFDFCPWRNPIGILDNRPDFSKYFQYGSVRMYLDELYQTNTGHLVLNLYFESGGNYRETREHLWATGTLHIGDRSFPMRNATAPNGLEFTPYAPEPHCNNAPNSISLAVCWKDQDELFASGENIDVRITVLPYGSVAKPYVPLDFRMAMPDWAAGRIALLWLQGRDNPCAGCAEYVQYQAFRNGVAGDWITIGYGFTGVSILRTATYATYLVDDEPGVDLEFCLRRTRGGQKNVAICTGTIPVGVGIENKDLPVSIHLAQNYPNPFNPSTTITYTLPASEHVRMAVYDMAGREIETLADGFRPAGTHTVWFDASGLPTGAYVYRLVTGSRSVSRIMAIVR